MQDTCLAPEKASPRTFLKQVDGLDGYLHVVRSRPDFQAPETGPTLEWFIYFKQGQISYASNNADAFERLERHLRALSHELPQLTAEVRSQLRAEFDQQQTAQDSHLTSDYQAIVWLVEQELLDPLMAGTLASKIAAEVFESYLLLPEAEYNVRSIVVSGLPAFCRLEPQNFVHRCEERLKLWRSLLPQIHSPYQRPYLMGEAVARQKLPPETVSSLSRLLIGFNFRQLGMFLKQDELTVAQRFSGLIRQGVVILRDPVAPFDLLPRLQPLTGAEEEDGEKTILQVGPIGNDAEFSLENQAEQRTWQIVCIDDSQAMLNEIQRLLEDNAFSLTLLTDPKKALMKIITIKPDLVMLDVTMPEVDGYQVCSMIRKSSVMRHIPVVMVTGNRGLIDRARAKMVGATDYLTKPFTQKDLLNILFRHLRH